MDRKHFSQSKLAILAIQPAGFILLGRRRKSASLNYSPKTSLILTHQAQPCIGGHNFQAWCPSVRHKETKTSYNTSTLKQYILQRYMVPGGSLNLPDSLFPTSLPSQSIKVDSYRLSFLRSGVQGGGGREGWVFLHAAAFCFS